MLWRYIALAAILAVVVPASALAQSSRHGDWTVSADASGTEAATINKSGSIFGFACIVSIDRCIYYISTHTTCDQGASSAILISSDSGALASTINCIKLGDSYYNSIQSTSDLATAISKGTTIGIAIPMESGQFKVVRFSLIGASVAIPAAATRAAELAKDVDHMQ